MLSYFRASTDEYEAIFTLNASGALKLIGESYPFGPGSQYLLTYDNHNSVNGIREFARDKGATFRYVPITDPELRIDAAALLAALDAAQVGYHNLFAYPAQSNFSGVQHSLDWIERAHERGWDVLLDAAAFVSLTDLLLIGLQGLHHRNGAPLIHMYGPTTNEERGGTIAMNFFDAGGALIHPKEIEREAGKRNISLRTGCHCNPGAGETALHITEEQMASLFRAKERMRFERFLHAADALKEGAVRASLGIVSNVADVDAFLRFAEQFRD